MLNSSIGTIVYFDPSCVVEEEEEEDKPKNEKIELVMWCLGLDGEEVIEIISWSGRGAEFSSFPKKKRTVSVEYKVESCADTNGSYPLF